MPSTSQSTIYGIAQRQQGYQAAQQASAARRGQAASDPFWQAVGQSTPRPAQNTSYAQGGGMGGFGFAGLAPGQNTSHVNQGSRNLGSVNWGAFAGIQNSINQMPPGPARSQYINQLRAQGLMPMYNGTALDQVRPGQFDVRLRTSTGTAGVDGGAAYGANGAYSGGPEHGHVIPHGTPYHAMAMGSQRAMGGGGTSASNILGRGSITMGGFTPTTGSTAVEGGGAFGARPGGGALGAIPQVTLGPGGFAGGPGAGGAGAGGLEGQVDSTLARLLGQGGSPYTASQRAGLVASQQDTVNRGTQDAIESARLDAARRGVDPSSLGSVEGEIRGRGAANAAQARLGAETSLSRESMQNLMAIIGSANTTVRDRRAAEIALGALQAQIAANESGVGGNSLNVLLGAYGGGGSAA